MPIYVHYFQMAAVDANFRLMGGARDRRLSVQTAASSGETALPPAPAGSAFALIETDANMRYTVTPASLAKPLLDLKAVVVSTGAAVSAAEKQVAAALKAVNAAKAAVNAAKAAARAASTGHDIFAAASALNAADAAELTSIAGKNAADAAKKTADEANAAAVEAVADFKDDPLPDGTSVNPDFNSLCLAASPFALQGPISIEQGDVLRITAYE